MHDGWVVCARPPRQNYASNKKSRLRETLNLLMCAYSTPCTAIMKSKESVDFVLPYTTELIQSYSLLMTTGKEQYHFFSHKTLSNRTNYLSRDSLCCIIDSTGNKCTCPSMGVQTNKDKNYSSFPVNRMFKQTQQST